MDIVQFSDFHFGNNRPAFDWREFAISLSDCLKLKVNNPVLIISGDITFRGQKDGYEEARSFFELLLEKSVGVPSKVIMCPGNHDIVEGSFEAFDKFTYALRRDKKCFFEGQPCREVLIDNCLFKLFNSSFHKDHEYGLVDSSSLETQNHEHSGLKIAVVHHHLLNMFPKDTSAIRNAYDLSNYLASNGFNYVLHGHQHAEQGYYLGKPPMRVISARSGNYIQQGYLNSVNIYRINDEGLAGEVLIPERSSAGIKIREIAL